MTAVVTAIQPFSAPEAHKTVSRQLPLTRGIWLTKEPMSDEGN
jgi:hypothetical protein